MKNGAIDDETLTVNSALRLVKEHEPFRAVPHKNSSNCQIIGYGTNLTERGITREEAELLVRRDLISVMARLELASYWPRLDVNRRAALLDFALSIGLERFDSLQSFLILLADGQFAEAADRIPTDSISVDFKTRAVDLVYIIRTGNLPRP